MNKTLFISHHTLEILLAMTEKDVKARYKRAVFGFLWIILNPLLQMFLIGTIFSLIIKSPIPHYFLFLFVGLLAWNFLSISINKSTPSLVHESALIAKARFNRAVIPLSLILANLFHFAVSLILVIFWSGFTQLLRPLAVFWLPVAIIWLFLLVTGISLLTSSLNVRYRDINFFTQVGLQLWLYATPILYPLSFIPDNYRFLYHLNPATGAIQLLQYMFAQQSFPATNLLLTNGALTALIAAFGLQVFKKNSPYFDDWL